MIFLYTDTTLETMLYHDITCHIWLNDKHTGEIYFKDNLFIYSNNANEKSFNDIKECLSYVYSKNNCNSDQLEIEISS